MQNLDKLYSLFDDELNLHEEEIQGTQYCVERSRDKGTDSQKECKDNDKSSILGAVALNEEENYDTSTIDISF